MSCEKNKAPEIVENSKTPLDVFAANRSFERAIFLGGVTADEDQPPSKDEIIATLVYDKENETVTVVYPDN